MKEETAGRVWVNDPIIFSGKDCRRGGKAMSRCKGCEQVIRWITTRPNNKPAPCDPQAVESDGEKMLVFADGVVARTHPDFKQGYISHFATCEKRDDFRKR